MTYIFPRHPDLAADVSVFIEAHGIKPTRFGKNAVNDAMLISQLEAGRELRSDTVKRIREYMLTGRVHPKQLKPIPA